MNKKKLTSFFINQRENRFKGLFRIILQIVSFSLLFLFIVVSTFKLSGILGIENSVLGRMMIQCFFLLVVLGITFLLGKYVDKRKWNEFGFKFNKQAVIDYFFGVITTGVLVCLSIFIMVKFSTLHIEKVRGLNLQLLYGLVSSICIGIYIEVLRSYQVLNLSESLVWKDYFTTKGAVIMAVIISSFLFSAGELIGTESAVNLFLHFMRAILLAGGYVLTRNLALSIGLHTGYNIFRNHIFSYQGEGAYIIKLGLGEGKSITDLSSKQIEALMSQFKVVAFSSRLVLIVILGLIVILWIRQRYSGINIDSDLAVYKQDSEED